jgi:hypothetical protein
MTGMTVEGWRSEMHNVSRRWRETGWESDADYFNKYIIFMYKMGQVENPTIILTPVTLQQNNFLHVGPITAIWIRRKR